MCRKYVENIECPSCSHRTHKIVNYPRCNRVTSRDQEFGACRRVQVYSRISAGDPCPDCRDDESGRREGRRRSDPFWFDWFERGELPQQAQPESGPEGRPQPQPQDQSPPRAHQARPATGPGPGPESVETTSGPGNQRLPSPDPTVWTDDLS